MRKFVPDELEHFTKVYGEANGKYFEFNGKGVGRPYEGVLQSKVTSSNDLHFPVHLLDIILVMGYPTYSEYQKEAFDMFKPSDGYEYERDIKYTNGGWMRTRHVIKKDDEGLHGDFKVIDCQTGEVPELIGIEPIVETFYPGGPGKVKSKMMVLWKKKDGGHFIGEVDSEYRLKHDMELPFNQFRLIDFKNTAHTPRCMDQSEVLRVVRNIDKIKFD